MEHQLQEGSDKCMNEPCHCTVSPGQQYCSQYCEAEAATGKSARACNCGHNWCQEART